MCLHLACGINSFYFSPSTSSKTLYIRFALFCSCTTTSSLVDSPVSASVTPPLFHFRLKTYTFFANLFIHHDSLPACRTDFTNFMTPDRFFWTTRFLFLVLFIIISVFWSRAVGLSWLPVTSWDARNVVYRFASYGIFSIDSAPSDWSKHTVAFLLNANRPSFTELNKNDHLNPLAWLLHFIQQWDVLAENSRSSTVSRLNFIYPAAGSWSAKDLIENGNALD